MRRILSLLLILTSFLGLFSFCSANETAAAPVVMVCLNAGKADCILLQIENHYYLVDTGYKRSSELLLEMLEHEGVTRLSGVFLTHNHKDHYGGLTALVASSIPIDAFYAPEFCIDGTDSKHPMVIAAAKRGQTVRFLKSGDSIKVSEESCFSILGPVALDANNENNNSLVMRLETSDGNILLTGDMKFEEEYQLISAGLLTRADVLKVSFHGDNTATSDSFLSIVKPRIGIISTSSKEEKDTPSKDTLYRLASVGCRVYVTQDAESAVRVELSDGNISVSMENWNQD